MTKKELAKAHGRNRRKITKSITQINRILNRAIKEKLGELEDASVRLLVVLYAAYLESSLNFLLNQYAGQIGNNLKEEVDSRTSQLDKWHCIIDALFRIRFLKGKQKPLTLLNLKHTNYNRYLYIKALADTEIRSLIELRNRLAHGQWMVAFNSENEEKNQKLTSKIWMLNKQDTMHIKNSTTGFVHIVDVLAASEGSFKKAFDEAVHRIESTKKQHDEQYDWIISEMHQKHVKHKQELNQ